MKTTIQLFVAVAIGFGLILVARHYREKQAWSDIVITNNVVITNTP